MARDRALGLSTELVSGKQMSPVWLGPLERSSFPTFSHGKTELGTGETLPRGETRLTPRAQDPRA